MIDQSTRGGRKSGTKKRPGLSTTASWPTSKELVYL